jgi:hypothetical protein
MGGKVGFLFCFLETNEGLKFTFLLVECCKDLIMLSVIICLVSEMRTRLYFMLGFYFVQKVIGLA